MRIHRLIIICLVATSLLASCKKEEKPNAHGDLNRDGISFTATTEGHDRNAKTYLDGEDIKWMAGDLILVQNSANQQAPFEVVDGIQTMNGTFYTGSTFDRSPAYDAAYPYSMATLSGTTATFTLPQQQQMTVTGTFGNGAMPMVAHSTNNVLNFYNVCGGVCFPLQGAGKHVTKIVLTSKNTADKLWGTFTASTTAVPVSGNVTSGPMPTHVSGSGGSNSVELICNGSTGITLTAEPQDFYIMVPPQTMTTGFTVTAYDGTNVIYSQDINWDAATHANFIKRSVVSKVQTAITISDPLTVTTVSPTFISTTSAYNQGTVTGESGNITECGFIYALASNLSSASTYAAFIADAANNLQIGKPNVYSPIVATTGTSFATEGMTGLTKDLVYVVRAYAKNASGVAYYGNPIPFATRKDYTNDYNGRIPYAFTVANGRRVNFSMGNLQYKASTNTWRFAEYQFEYVGGEFYGSNGNVYANGEHPNASQNGTRSSNNNVSSTYSQWIDFYGWGTSGYHNNSDPYNIYYTPYTITSYSPIGSSPQNTGYGPSYQYNSEWNLTGSNANYDWGVYNNISNDGSYGAGAWRTLTGGYAGDNSGHTADGEAIYLFNSRSQTYVYAWVALNVRSNQTVNGEIVFCDQFVWPYYVNNVLTCNETGIFANNSLTEAEWSILEKNGAVFLPAGGMRESQTDLVMFPSFAAMYWTSTRALYNGPYNNYFNNSHIMAFIQGEFDFDQYMQHQGMSVRLVRNVN